LAIIDILNEAKMRNESIRQAMTTQINE